MMRTSQPGWNEGAITLSASRSRRRTRFRATALPSARPVARPKRVVSSSVRRNRAESRLWERVVPASWIAAKSCGRESITSRGVTRPRSLVRPSVASDPEPAERQGCADPQSSSCGRGNRAPWRGGASWADRSASSGRSCDPLESDLGDGSLRLPLEARRRARRPSGHVARRRPADDMASSEGVSNDEGAGRTPGRAHARGVSRARRERRRASRTDTPGGYVRIALRRRRARCYPLRALGAGDVRGRRQQPREVAKAAVIRPRRMDVRRDAPPPSHPRDPWLSQVIIVVNRT